MRGLATENEPPEIDTWIFEEKLNQEPYTKVFKNGRRRATSDVWQGGGNKIVDQDDVRG